MTALPKISVIFPILSRPKHLKRAIASILKQNFSELELIVVDGSGDDSVCADVAAFSAADARVHYVQSQSSDATAAMTLGLRAARAPWLAFQRDGDEWLLDRLGQQLACAEQQGEQCHLVAGRLLQYMPVALTKMMYWSASPEGRLEALEARSDLAALLQTALVRRSLLETVPAFDVQSAESQDFDWCRRLIKQGGAFTITGCVAVTYVSSGIKKPHPMIDWFSKALKR